MRLTQHLRDVRTRAGEKTFQLQVQQRTASCGDREIREPSPFLLDCQHDSRDSGETHHAHRAADVRHQRDKRGVGCSPLGDRPRVCEDVEVLHLWAFRMQPLGEIDELIAGPGCNSTADDQQRDDRHVELEANGEKSRGNRRSALQRRKRRVEDSPEDQEDGQEGEVEQTSYITGANCSTRLAAGWKALSTKSGACTSIDTNRFSNRSAESV